MADEQPAQGSAPSVEDRLTALFSAPASEVAPEPEADAVEASEDAPELTAEEAAPEDDGLDDLDLDGVQYRVPKDLKAKVSEWKEGALRREDYTRKTQELAELQRQVSTIAETAQIRAKFEEATAGEREELTRIKADLDRYKAVDWGSLEIGDYIKLKHQADSLKERAGEIERTIRGKEQQFGQWAEGRKREVIAQGHKYLQTAIKGWGQESMQDATKVAQELGFTGPEIERMLDPRIVHALYESAQWRKLQSGKTAAVTQAQKAPPVVKPGAVNQSAAVSKDKVLRDRVRKSGDLKDVAALLAHRMR
jgi:hypothetical protein